MEIKDLDKSKILAGPDDNEAHRTCVYCGDNLDPHDHDGVCPVCAECIEYDGPTN